MLKTKCPNCKCSVKSTFLVEAQQATCDGCGETFIVKDIYISVGPYTIYKEVVLENTPNYVRLLRELRAEAARMEERGKDSLPYRESAKTVNLFVNMLRELLEGCRDKPRVPGGKATVEYYIDETAYHGVLKNISSTGICFAISDKSLQIGPGRIIKLSVKDEGLSEPLCLKAWVVWSTEKGITGLKFVGLDAASRETLCKFIAYKGSTQNNEANRLEGAVTGA